MLLPDCEEEGTTKAHVKNIAIVSEPFECVGRWFESCVIRQRSGKSSLSFVKTDDKEEDDEEDNTNDILTKEEKEFILKLDAAEWKKQDHYRVLRIPQLRGKATDEDVKKAYRKMVLKYHPDRKKKTGSTQLALGVNEHDYFTCITKAFEQLSTTEGRQAFDSVDEEFDDSIPTYHSNSKENFYKVFAPVFNRNSRWSKVQPVPLLGDENTSQDDVHAFYTFWFEFKSWRNFSYLDNEDKDKAENREERRWIERENKQMRQKRKKEEIQRIRSFVDCAYQNDPRLKKFREAEKQKKIELKQAKEQAEKEKEMERQQALEEERKIKAKEEQAAKEKALKEKKDKEKLRKLAARDRKIIRQCVKDEGYFSLDSDNVTSLNRLEKTLETLSPQRLEELRKATEEDGKTNLKNLYTQYSNEVLKKLKEEAEERRRQEELASSTATKQTKSEGKTDSTWSDTELQLLVKATTLFPVGTASRWEVIAAYVNEHSDSKNKKTGKQVISKVKSLKKLDPSLKEDVNKHAYKNLEKATSIKMQQQSNSNPSVKETEEKQDTPWSSDEQKLLEQALKTHGASTPERWEKIASLIPTRTKKECMKRYKELVEMVKAKKAAAAAQQQR